MRRLSFAADPKLRSGENRHCHPQAAGGFPALRRVVRKLNMLARSSLVTDAFRLSRAMSYKRRLFSGLPLGGGWQGSVIIGEPRIDKTRPCSLRSAEAVQHPRRPHLVLTEDAECRASPATTRSTLPNWAANVALARNRGESATPHERQFHDDFGVPCGIRGGFSLRERRLMTILLAG